VQFTIAHIACQLAQAGTQDLSISCLEREPRRPQGPWTSIFGRPRFAWLQLNLSKGRLDDIEPRVRIRNQKVVCTTAAAYIVTVTGTDGATGKLTANTIVYMDVK